MRFFSIRWRLVLSTMLLTVLAVSVVIALALGLLQQNVNRQETDSLQANANAIAQQALPMMAPQPRVRELQQLARTSAFLSNARVVIRDANDRILADSGRASSDQMVLIVPPELSVQPNDPAALLMQALLSDEINAAQGSVLSKFPAGTQFTLVRRVDGPWGSRLVFEAVSQAPKQLSEASDEVRGQQRVVEAAIPSSLNRLSEQTRANMPLGYVRVSSARSFGVEALTTTTQLLVLAGIIATAFAALLGLWVSRSLTAPLQSLAVAANRMGQGDLSARAFMPKRPARDEIEQLSGQFNGMAVKLEASFGELSAERDALRRFIADASHELRTPITALKMSNELLQGQAGDDPATRAEFLAQNTAQLNRLEWITHNLLDLSRLDAGIAHLNLAQHDASDLTASAAKPFKQVAEQKGIRLNVFRLPSPVSVRCDWARIEIALSNLIDNAIKFTPSGGRIDVCVETDGAVVRLMVQDTGIGVVERDRARIFERFYRGDNHRADGSGLGLAIVKSIAQAHGGRAYVESKPGQGSVFGIELPVIPQS